MNEFEFYKEFYFKELEVRNEINNSLTLPIGLITGLVAGISYFFTHFDFTESFCIQILFLIPIGLGIVFLIVSVYHLIIAYANFPKGYEYFILADTNDLDKYKQELIQYHSDNPEAKGSPESGFDSYILSEMIKSAGNNQKNNKRKYKFRYDCEKFLIMSFVFICLSLPAFVINQASKSSTKKLDDLSKNCNFTPILISYSHVSASNTSASSTSSYTGN